MEKSWVYCKNKTESQRQEFYLQNLRVLENSWFQGTLIDKSSPQSLHSYTENKLKQRVNNSRARRAMSILQQSRNTALNIKRQAAQSHAKPIDTPKLTIGHFIALQREEIQLNSPEHRHKLP